MIFIVNWMMVQSRVPASMTSVFHRSGEAKIILTSLGPPGTGQRAHTETWADRRAEDNSSTDISAQARGRVAAYVSPYRRCTYVRCGETDGPRCPRPVALVSRQLDYR